jgi:putative methyltransferase (TIGR04325 family)
MGIVDVLSRWLPPAVWEVARGFRGEWRYVAPAWPEQPAVRGWEAGDVADAHRAGWDGFVQSVIAPHPLGLADPTQPARAPHHALHNTFLSYAYAFAVASRGRTGLSMLDWGAGTGHYRRLTAALFPEVALEYHAREVAANCRAGRELVPDGTFHESDEGCLGRSYDFVMASASLHYWRDWPALLERLARASLGYVLVTRLPVLLQQPDYVALQRAGRYGYATEYLAWFVNRARFLEQAARCGLALEREFLLQERPRVPGAPEQAEYRGFLFRRLPPP